MIITEEVATCQFISSVWDFFEEEISVFDWLEIEFSSTVKEILLHPLVCDKGRFLGCSSFFVILWGFSLFSLRETMEFLEGLMSLNGYKMT